MGSKPPALTNVIHIRMKAADIWYLFRVLSVILGPLCQLMMSTGKSSSSLARGVRGSAALNALTQPAVGARVDTAR